METYQKWYRRIVHAGLLSLLVIFLSLGVAGAEENEVSNTSDVFPGSVQLVTQSADGNGVYANHAVQSMSEDGSFVFTSNAKNLVTPPTTGGEERFYFFDNVAKTVSVLPSFGTDGFLNAQITPDKQWIVLSTFDYTLKIHKVFLYSTATAELMPVTKADGTTIDIEAFNMTADASVVAISTLQKLLPTDTNSKYDLYLWNRSSKEAQLLTTTPGNAAAGIERPVKISDDGAYVSYIGNGANFPSCGTRTFDVYRKNVQTGEVVCVTEGVEDSDGEYFNNPQMSADGSVFLVNGLVTVGLNPQTIAIYLVNLNNSTTPTLLFNQSELNALKFFRLTADGKQVVYSNGIYTDPNNLRKFCVYEIATASHSCTTRPEGTQDGDLNVISPTGRFSVISSWDHSWIGSVADNIKPISQDRWSDLFIWDREGVNNAISGKVTGDDGTTGLADVTLTNGTRERYITDASGQYTMPYLNAGQMYEITPALYGKTFYPASKMVTAPKAGVDFSTGGPASHTLSGKVMYWEDNNSSVPAQSVTASVEDKDGNTTQVTTDIEGKYTFFLPSGDYTVSVSIGGYATYAQVTNVDGLPENRSNVLATVSQDVTDVDFLALPCVSPVTQLDICALQKGDILLKDTAGETDSYIAITGSYFMHAAIYSGDGNIVEAAGRAQDRRREVRNIAIQANPFYRSNSDKVRDWTVLRLKEQYQGIIDQAVAKALAKAYEPEVQYATNLSVNFFDPMFIHQEQEFYCSMFVWWAYKEWVNLESNLGYINFIPSHTPLLSIFYSQVLPDDIYDSAIELDGPTTIEQDMPGNDSVSRFVWSVWSPARIRVTNDNGENTGYDPSTGGEVSEIPGSFYSGIDSEPQWVRGAVTGPVNVTLYGTGDGEYALIAREAGLTYTVASVYTSTISLGETLVFTINPVSEAGGEVEIVPPAPDKEELKVYLPVVVK